jgi:hypothetical protein
MIKRAETILVETPFILYSNENGTYWPWSEEYQFLCEQLLAKVIGLA